MLLSLNHLRVHVQTDLNGHKEELMLDSGKYSLDLKVDKHNWVNSKFQNCCKGQIKSSWESLTTQYSREKTGTECTGHVVANLFRLVWLKNKQTNENP